MARLGSRAAVVILLWICWLAAVPARAGEGEEAAAMDDAPPASPAGAATQAPVVQQDAMNDRQGPAPRSGDYTLDPEYEGFLELPNTRLIARLDLRPRVDMMATSDEPGTDFRFVPSLFPVPGEAGYGGGWRFDGNANGSQIRLDFRAPSLKGDLRLYYQNDFFGDTQKPMRYRLQHLYGQFYGLLAGFTFSVFEDPDAWPQTVDYEGPNAAIHARRALAHYKRRIGDAWEITLAIEAPDSFVDTTGDDEAAALSRAPDGGFHVRWSPEIGHVQLSTIFRNIAVDGSTFEDQGVFGWGLGVSGALEVTSRDVLIFWLNYGEGIGGMGNDTSFQPSDAAFTAAGELVALRYWSAMGAITHHWSRRWSSTLTYGYVDLETTDGQPGSAYRLSHYGSANVAFRVFAPLHVGLEGLYGRKQVRDGRVSEVYRVQLGITFSIF